VITKKKDPTKIFGLILSGGRSLRMGQDKGLIPYYGKPQREYLHDLLSKMCDEVHLSCKSAIDVPAELCPIEDRYELSSPLNGILSAFSHNSEVAWLTLPVDMPLIDEDAIRLLINNRDRDKVATCYVDSDGEKPEPLFALWESHAFPLLQSFHASGEFSPRKFLIDHAAKLLTPTTQKIYHNVNTPEELKQFLTGSDDVN
jgi:molybdopterin-guanine dinucleotide biosynthesis protein A